uniref:PLA2c domain-containing protein n=1 Tax=Eptatretus burgeri TaxID=7764 RepID=A0A8C4NAF3_EPTBU
MFVAVRPFNSSSSLERFFNTNHCLFSRGRTKACMFSRLLVYCSVPFYLCSTEWVEFTPHEVGLPKYGAFAKMQDFGSEFFMGHVVRRHPELPLHYLLGLWGSAFAASLDRIYLELTGKNLKLLDLLQNKIRVNPGAIDPQRPTLVVTPVGMLQQWLQSMLSSHLTGQNYNLLSGLFLDSSYATSRGFVSSVDHIDSQPNKLTPMVPRMLMVDSGLDMASAYPLIFLRPERQVDLIISFDYSWQAPFTGLLHAKKFCADRGLAFPALEIEEMSLDSVQECYMFADSEDPLAPIILHFPLINQTFQQYKTVGELRQTEEERAFGDFDVYYSESPYRTINFTYTDEQFERLWNLACYNVENNADTIREALRRALNRRKCRACGEI